MQRLLDQAVNLIRDARELTPQEATQRLGEAIALLEAVRPGKERDGMMALAYMRLAQTQRGMGKKADSERSFMVGYSYARTSREERVRRLAEELSEEFVG